MPGLSRSTVWISIAVGVGLGVFSILGDGIVRWLWLTLAGNMAAPWALAAFLVGRRASNARSGALVGILVLGVATLTYYAIGGLRGYVTNVGNVVWTVLAFAAGPLMGAAGALTARGTAPHRRWAIATPAAVLLGEALYLAWDWRFVEWDVGLGGDPQRPVRLAILLALVIGGLAVPPALEPDLRRRVQVYGQAVVGAVVAAGTLLAVREIILAFT